MASQRVKQREELRRYGLPPGTDQKKRIWWLFGLFSAAFAGIIVNLVFLHLFPSQRLLEVGASHVAELALQIPRGEIRDTNNGLLAGNREVYSLWADPRKVADPYTTALLLSAHMGLEEEGMAFRLSKRDEMGRQKKFVWVKRRLSDAEYAKFLAIKERLGPGFDVRKELIRSYPENQLVAHVIGYSNDNGVGCEGIERSFDKYLRSTPGLLRSHVDAKRKVLESETIEHTAPEGGHTVYLTIDKAIQYSLERELEAALDRTEADRGMGILMDPRTGAVLALACRPTFDPNTYSKDPGFHGNRAFTEVFEPGSSFKILTFAAALELGLVTPDKLIDCEWGRYVPYGHPIHDFHPMGVEPVEICFAHSSNIATVKIAAMLGEDRLDAWIHRFGFGERVCSDFLGESPGIVWPRAKWTRYTMGAIPIGQEIAVTLPQLARAFSVIANGGHLVEPYLVDRVQDREGEVVYRHESKVSAPVLSPETAATMTAMMHKVVTEGTGTYASIPEYRACGKTGTGQIASPDGKGFLDDKYTAIFAGFAPVADPRICAVIVIQEPGIKLHYGGYCCGPVFKEVVREALVLLGAPEDPVADVVVAAEPVPEDSDFPAARAIGESETRRAGLDTLELTHVDVPATAEPALPSFRGLTMRQAKEALGELGLPWDFQGTGRVVLQDPPEHTPLDQVTLCRLVFSNRPVATQDETERTDSTPRM
ncbi:MAG TPA: penicillin-binding transpeptidase domain-containing protein [Candidatus Hydrogenedentes bacterium]|nr:penicillin-binding transpeptidase domain-containing protein [Candidatus Hydrogenedentota bacterium]HPG68090.1 penicillin-binding transpeptidase domain-containing protein [Candidatus Hydrogenedentota bacterium]